MSKKYPCPAGREDDCGYPSRAHDRQCETAASEVARRELGELLALACPEVLPEGMDEPLVWQAEQVRTVLYELRRTSKWNEDAWRRAVKSRAHLLAVLEGIVAIANDAPDMLADHILASDSPVRAAMGRANYQ